MSLEAKIAIAAIAVTLIGHGVNFGLLILHCRRDKSRFKKIEDWR